jgi:surface protein
MFENATSFNQPIGSWNVSKVTIFNSFMNGKTNLNYTSNNLDLINKWLRFIIWYLIDEKQITDDLLNQLYETCIILFEGKIVTAGELPNRNIINVYDDNQIKIKIMKRIFLMKMQILYIRTEEKAWKMICRTMMKMFSQLNHENQNIILQSELWKNYIEFILFVSIYLRKDYMMNEILFLLQEYEEELKDFLTKHQDYQIIYEKVIQVMENYNDHEFDLKFKINEYWQEKCKLYYLL